MKKKKNRTGWLVLASFVVAGGSYAEVIVAGWDNSFNIGAAIPESADHVAGGISAEAFWSGQNPARSASGSGDLTFGTFAGAIESVDLATGSQIIYETTLVEFTVVNNGLQSYDFSSFHFDAWRAFAGGSPSVQISVLAGSDITVGVIGTNTLAVQGANPVIGSDYEDVDVSLAGLADRTLDPGEQVVFRLETTSGAVYVDNFALTGEEAAEPLTALVAGWDYSFDIGAAIPEPADQVDAGIMASVVWSGQNPSRSSNGSGDLTFGTFAGASDSTNLTTGAQVIYDTTFLDFSITNNSAQSMELSAFRFDAWRSFSGGAPSVQISVLAGSDITEGLVGDSGTLPIQGIAPAVGSDYSDIDLSLVGLADHTLGVGEQVVFRLETTSGSIYVDNFAVTKILVVGYSGWASGWGVDIGSETDDYDLDGLLNIHEYGLDGDPTNELDQGTSPTFEIAMVGGSNVFTYIHPQLSDSNSGLIYYLELNTDLALGSWTNNGYSITGTNITAGTLDFVTNVTSIVEGQKFISLHIESE